MKEAGVIRVDKPAGPTSHDVVAAARRALGERRIGHTGTLDPFATGLLLVCVGRTATRLAPLLTALPKTYRAVARLGEETTTEDLTGDVTQRMPVDALDPARVTTALEAMRGESMQMPPAFSAKRVAGKRAYASAREGVEVELQPVPVTIHRLDVIDVRLPDVEFEVECSSGTYIRSIARDVGRALGVGGHLTSLRRTAIGAHTVEGGVAPDALGDAEALRAAWLSPVEAVAHLPLLAIDEAQADRITHGMSIPAPEDAGQGTIALTRDDALIGIGVVDGEAILPRKVFA